MSLFVDTSTFYALLDADDQYNRSAAKAWTSVNDAGRQLVTSNYVVVETCALVHNRLGLPVVRRFREDVLPVVAVCWIDEAIHDLAFDHLLISGRRGLSIVDCVSFVLMHELGIREVLAFDRHFREEGFHCIP